MADWNKIVYWKNRMNEKIRMNFDLTIAMLKEIQETIGILKVRKPVELKRIIQDFGSSYDELKKMIDTLDDEPLQKE